jgi:hypothetical protein
MWQRGSAGPEWNQALRLALFDLSTFMKKLLLADKETEAQRHMSYPQLWV